MIHCSYQKKKFKVEPSLRFPMKYIYKERLRAGTVELMNYIQSEGIELWIYTTSFRSERYIRGLFRCYGIKPDQVVNGQRHADEVQKDHAEGMPSKYPSKYRIDLHIDDDISVAQNGRTYGFRVFTVGEQDDEWAEKIKAEIAKIRNRNEKQ
ncbi:hypothetical protein Rumal_1193 [Ruminococcus albus 7 = DSM 20455]|uniref:Uncharacterized protein n=2 Tax=Ruminococcus albus TaxID=1264 RepID=E6UDA7_RUMA7|nr:hypothetical protein Rumal_1193 [Ruminococcus albus 7 = DSM 20455]